MDSVGSGSTRCLVWSIFEFGVWWEKVELGRDSAFKEWGTWIRGQKWKPRSILFPHPTRSALGLKRRRASGLFSTPASRVCARKVLLCPRPLARLVSQVLSFYLSSVVTRTPGHLLGWLWARRDDWSPSQVLGLSSGFFERSDSSEGESPLRV